LMRGSPLHQEKGEVKQDHEHYLHKREPPKRINCFKQGEEKCVEKRNACEEREKRPIIIENKGKMWGRKTKGQAKVGPNKKAAILCRPTL